MWIENLSGKQFDKHSSSLIHQMLFKICTSLQLDYLEQCKIILLNFLARKSPMDLIGWQKYLHE